MFKTHSTHHLYWFLINSYYLFSPLRFLVKYCYKQKGNVNKNRTLYKVGVGHFC